MKEQTKVLLLLFNLLLNSKSILCAVYFRNSGYHIFALKLTLFLQTRSVPPKFSTIYSLPNYLLTTISLLQNISVISSKPTNMIHLTEIFPFSFILLNRCYLIFIQLTFQIIRPFLKCYNSQFIRVLLTSISHQHTLC